MFIAHLPAAYLGFRFLAPPGIARPVLLAGLAGGVAPDLDLLWFFLVDDRAQHHHHYLTHRPAVWMVLLAVCLLSRRIAPPPLPAIGTAFAAGALIHMLCDSVAGRIAWAWPLSGWAHPQVTVPATHRFWVVNFLTHWTFLMEIALCLMATAVLAWPPKGSGKKEKPGRHGPGSSIS